MYNHFHRVTSLGYSSAIGLQMVVPLEHTFIYSLGLRSLDSRQAERPVQPKQPGQPGQPKQPGQPRQPRQPR